MEMNSNQILFCAMHNKSILKNFEIAFWNSDKILLITKETNVTLNNKSIFFGLVVYVRVCAC